MTKYQIAYKEVSEDKELSFTTVRGIDIVEALGYFIQRHPDFIIYSVLRCGKPS